MSTQKADKMPATSKVDLQRPWLGLRSFGFQTHRYFFGRDAEIDELFRRVRLTSLTTLYSPSGLGKTSLLLAGLIPRLLRERESQAAENARNPRLGETFGPSQRSRERSAETFHPIYCRLSYLKNALKPSEQLVQSLTNVPEKRDSTSPNEEWKVPDEFTGPTESWVVPREFADLAEDPLARLWLWAHDVRRKKVTPVIIIDQFEEIFTVGGECEDFDTDLRSCLQILIYGAQPEAIRLRFLQDAEYAVDAFFPERSETHAAFGGDSASGGGTAVAAPEFARLDEQFDPERRNLRLVLSLREEWVHALDRWRHHLPSIVDNRFELRALRGPEALESIYRPGELQARYRIEGDEWIEEKTDRKPLVSEATALQIVRYLAPAKSKDKPLENIENIPPILSLLCRELNERRFAEPHSPDRPAEQIVFPEKAENIDEILEAFFHRCVDDRPDSVRYFIEEDLISPKGYRRQLDEASCLDMLTGMGRGAGRFPASLTVYQTYTEAHQCLDELVDERLLVRVGPDESPHYELTHDLLCEPVLKSRLAREDRQARMEAEEGRKKAWIAAVILGSLLLLVVFSGWKWYRLEQAAADALRQKVETEERDRKNRIARDEAEIRERIALEQTEQFRTLARQKEEASEKDRATAKRAAEAHRRYSWSQAVRLSSLRQGGAGAAYLLRALKELPEDPVLAAQLWLYLRHGLLGRGWTLEQRLPSKEKAVKLAWSPDEQYLARVGENAEMEIWDVLQGTFMSRATLEAWDKAAAARSTILFLPDKTVLVDNGRGYWRFYDMVTGQSKARGRMMQNPINPARLSPNQLYVVLPFNPESSRRLGLYSTVTGKFLNEFRGALPSVTSSIWRPDSSKFVHVTLDGTLQERSGSTGERVGAAFSYPTSSSAYVWGYQKVHYDPTGKFLIVDRPSASTKRLTVWSMDPAPKEIKAEDTFKAVNWDRLTGMLQILSGSGDAKYLDPNEPGASSQVRKLVGGMGAADLQRREGFRVPVAEDEVTYILDQRSGEKLHSPAPRRLPAASTVLSPRERFIAQNLENGDTLIWRLPAARLTTWDFSPMPRQVRTLTSSDGRWQLNLPNSGPSTVARMTDGSASYPIELLVDGLADATWDGDIHMEFEDGRRQLWKWNPPESFDVGLADAIEALIGYRVSDKEVAEALPWEQQLSWRERLRAANVDDPVWRELRDWWLAGRPSAGSDSR